MIIRYNSLKIFIYMHSEQLNRLTNECLLPIAPPSNFNDPFECLLSKSRKFTKEEWLFALENFEIFKQVHNAQVRPKLTLRNIIDVWDDLPDISGALLGFAIQGFNKMVSEQFAILCCTLNEACPLMWAHYARKHTGFVIQLNSELCTSQT